MNYYINIAKTLEPLTAKELEEGEAEVSRALMLSPSEEISAYATHPDMETKIRVFMTKMFPEMLRDSLNSNATLTASVLYDAKEKPVFYNMKLLVQGVGEDSSGRVVYVTPLGTITVI